MTADLGFIHVFKPAQNPGAPTLLLLHGTGGDEHDLVPLGGLVARRRRSSARAARCSRTACRASSAGSPKASSTSTI